MSRTSGFMALAIVGLASLADAQVRTALPDQRGVPLSAFPRTIELAENEELEDKLK